MKTNRTKKILISYLKEEIRHNEKMAKISNNDYDIHYYDGRSLVAQYILEKLESQEKFDIDELLKLIRKEQLEDMKDRKKFYRENHCDDEKTIGYIDEFGLLYRIFRQDYSI